jgi:hypothetical protein
MRSARGDAERACQTSTIPPSAARSARCASAGASLQRSTAAPEALHRSGPRSRSGTTRWRAREAQQPHRLTIPRDALPTRLASFCLLAMASPPRDTRRNPWISQHTSGIVSGADRRFSDVLSPVADETRIRRCSSAVPPDRSHAVRGENCATTPRQTPDSHCDTR